MLQCLNTNGKNSILDLLAGSVMNWFQCLEVNSCHLHLIAFKQVWNSTQEKQQKKTVTFGLIEGS